MSDVVSREIRSRMMASIRAKNTKPEMIIRRGLHRMGFRYRLHDSRLPGRPDLVFPRYRAVILVQGCFWHMHECNLFRWPSTREAFWRDKLTANKERDLRSLEELHRNGWRTLTVWECAMKGPERLSPEQLLRLCADWLLSGGDSLSIQGAKF